jgi:hypothetical protein
MEQQKWDEKVRAAWESQRPRVERAQGDLDEDIAVLRMFSPTLARPPSR